MERIEKGKKKTEINNKFTVFMLTRKKRGRDAYSKTEMKKSEEVRLVVGKSTRADQTVGLVKHIVDGQFRINCSILHD